MVDASPVAAPDTREVPDLSSACVRMNIGGLSEVAKALCGAVGSWIKYQGRPVCSRSRLCTVRKERKSTTIKKKIEIDTQESFSLLFTTISSSRIVTESLASQDSCLREMIYLADHRLKKNSDEYIESILWLYLF